MKEFRFKIQEQCTYWQEGHVTVIAVDLKRARSKVLKGKYTHEGDNEVLLDTAGPVKNLEIISEEEI